MQAHIEIPYEFEAMALYLGVTPKTAANAVLDWFTEPMEGTGLLVHRNKPRLTPRRARLAKQIGDFARQQGLSRSVVLDRMVERAQLSER